MDAARAGGARVLLATKGGTNEFHGITANDNVHAAGDYTFRDFRTSKYSVTAEHSGFKTLL